MKKLALLILAFVAACLPADMAMARGGGRGGGGRGGGGRGGRGLDTGGSNRKNKAKDKKSRQMMRDRALAENKDAIKRDARIDSI